MSFGDGFVDLRANNDSAADGNESFWPSFTDIMTVIVMIFLLASTVLILRNWELVSELRATITAEREASAQVRSATKANITLEEQLAQAEHQISVMRMWLMQAREDNEDNLKRLSEKDAQLATVIAERRQLSDFRLSSERRIESLEEQFRLVNEQLTSLREVHGSQEARLRSTLEELDTQLRDNRSQADELARLRQADEGANRQLADLQGEYDRLKVSYDKLVRPARTAQGKHVVEVRYVKSGGKSRIGYREVDRSATLAPVSREELDRRLGRLKQQYGDGLYVKIIIPEDSGLSYSEAWNFTKTLLNRYDYYGVP
ncbi:MAG: hypothetical protein U9R74_07425 [Pseudomonadota bacterium]|nr:hypothetical protein [Pseudomonadota bacterium]